MKILLPLAIGLAVAWPTGTPLAQSANNWHGFAALPNNEAFEQEVLSRSQSESVIVFFYAEWCIYCAELAPTLASLAETYQGRLRIVGIDVDITPETAQRFDVEGIPAVIAFEGGMALTRLNGLPETELLTDLFESYARAEPSRTGN